MNYIDIADQRLALLKEFEQQFADARVPARIVDAIYDGEDHDTRPKMPDILTVLMESLAVDGKDAVAEFFFLPSEPDDEVQVFMNVLTIVEEIPEERINDLLAAVSVVNMITQVGAFVVEIQSKRLVYRHSYELPMGIEEEALADSVDLCMGTAVDAVSKYAYILVEVADGERDLESVMAMLEREVE